jgi:hypothetical protein
MVLDEKVVALCYSDDDDDDDDYGFAHRFSLMIVGKREFYPLEKSERLTFAADHSE